MGKGHRMAVAVVAALASTAVHGNPDLEARIALLEAELEALKAEIADSKASTEAKLVSIEMQAGSAVDEAKSATARVADMAVAPALSDTEFKYGGFVQLDTIVSRYSEGRPDRLLDDLFVPSLVPIEGADGESSDPYTSINMHAKTSRFFFKTDTDTRVGRIRSHIELDFILSDQGDERVSNSFGSRLRHAYVEWQFAPDGSLMAGQNWSTFFNVDALPDYLDFVGPVGSTFERQPQIRLTKGPWMFAIENKTTRTNTPDGGSSIDDNKEVPDVVVRYNGETGDLDWALATVIRQLSYEVRPDPRREIESDDKLGYGVSLTGKWQLGMNDLRFQANYGNALGRYLGLNAFNDGYIALDGDIETMDQWGAVLSYRHYWTPTWRSTFGVAASGADNPTAADFAAAGGLAKEYQSMHINLNYVPTPQFQLGGEVMYGRKEVEDGRSGDMARLQFAVKFAF